MRRFYHLYRYGSQHGCVPAGRRRKGQALCASQRGDHDHQPSGGAKGQATDIQIVAENILKTKERLNRILAENTGKPIEVVAADTERDNFMSAQEAMEYGLIDAVISSRQ